MRSVLSCLSVAAATVAFAAPALAQDAAPAPERSIADEMAADSITVAVAAAYISDYEGSDDYRFTPAPAVLATVKGYTLTVLGNRASLDLIRDNPGPTWDLQAGPIVLVNFNRNSNKNIDDRRVRALGKLDTAIELGGYVGIGKTGVITSPYDKLSLTLSYRHDVSDVHDSAIWQPTLSYFTPLSRKAAVGLFASAERAGTGYARTYFSVDAPQSLTSGLPVYNARGGWKNWNLGGLGSYALTGDLLKGWKAIGGVVYRRMLNDFSDSPLVSIAGSRSQWAAALGVGYTF